MNRSAFESKYKEAQAWNGVTFRLLEVFNLYLYGVFPSPH